jgi:hypothetical protein
MRGLIAAMSLSGCIAEVNLRGVEPPVYERSVVTDAAACGFETGELSGWGHPGEDRYHADEGGYVMTVPEGADFSALRGEEDVELNGQFALLLRSNDAGEVDSVAVLRTGVIQVPGPTLTFVQLSEVGGAGIDLALRVLDEDGGILDEIAIPAVNGGYVPALQPQHQPIEGYPEIGYGEPTVGAMTMQSIDLYAYLGDFVMLELRQHTNVPENGFFTLLDDVCIEPLS